MQNKKHTQKTYKGGKNDDLDKFMSAINKSKQKSAIITQEMVELYGYPEKYIGYNVAIPPNGIENPFTIFQMCKLCWLSQAPLNFENINSKENLQLINSQVNVDINRDVEVKINGEDVKKNSKSGSYSEFIEDKIRSFPNMDEENITLTKILLTQFPLSVASDIMSITLPQYKNEHVMVQPLNPNTIELYKSVFPNINDNKSINLKVIDGKVIIDEEYFTSLIILLQFDPFGNITDEPMQNAGVASVYVYCDFELNKGFFIWKSQLNPEQSTQVQPVTAALEEGEAGEGEETGIPAAKSYFNKLLIGTSVVSILGGVVAASLASTGILGGSTKKNKINIQDKIITTIKSKKTKKLRPKN
jgi:hypothetical protein